MALAAFKTLSFFHSSFFRLFKSTNERCEYGKFYLLKQNKTKQKRPTIGGILIHEQKNHSHNKKKLAGKPPLSYHFNMAVLLHLKPPSSW